ncbi:hypothetical protein N8T08_006074 [Aspergillus melleus]|uniref:Uncharacterized protein n=1 Tax=Aspergillus melleus TaxID=138277 RepID=A0ACC3B0K6_9EURO|nr:hypothetical protein N8T08_006074 [Aspergillus melleus]
MDVLKSLHTSVAETFEKTFDDAYRDLYAEIKSRDCKVEDAEKKAKCAEEARVESAAEARELKHEIAILQEELARNDVNAEDTQVSADRISKLKETFSPQHILIFGGSHAGLDTGFDSKPNEIVKEKYAALYNEFMTLIKATDGLRLQIKRQKRKLTYWRECLDREKFTLVLDGIPVKFERKQSTVGESQLQGPKRCYETKLSSCATEGPKKAGSKSRSKQSSPQPGGHYGMASPNPQDKQPNQSHEDTSPTVLPSSPGRADDSSRVSVANPGSSRHPTGDPLHINPRSDYDAEDGDEVVRKRRMGNSPRDASSGARCTQFHFSEDAAITGRRLHNLLESPLPPRPSLQQRQSIQTEVDGEHSHQHKELGLTKSVDIDVSSSIRSTPAQGEKTQVPRARRELPSDPSSRANDCEVGEMHPGDEPYRARPLRRLDLSHFKINPNHNQGLDFAYDDVVPLFQPSKWLPLYEDFVTKNASSVGQVESALRSLTYIIPGRYRDSEIPSECVSPPLPEREVDPRSLDGEEENDWNGMQTPENERLSDLGWTMPRTGLSLPSLPDVNDVSNYLISKVLTADDIKPPKALLHRVTGHGHLAEVLYILRPVLYALAMQRWRGDKKSWRPWLIGFGMEYGCRQLAKSDFKERVAGGLRGLTGLEREELRKRGWAMGWWFFRGAFYENITKYDNSICPTERIRLDANAD